MCDKIVKGRIRKQFLLPGATRSGSKANVRKNLFYNPASLKEIYMNSNCK